MADIRKRRGPKGVSYQVRYKDQNGQYRYKSFARRKDADGYRSRSAVEVDLGVHIHDRDSITMSEAVDIWLHVCEHVGRDDREPVEASTLAQYRRHATVIKARLGARRLKDLGPAAMIEFRDGLIDDMSRAMAGKIVTSAKGVLAEMRSRELTLADPPKVGVSKSSRDQSTVVIPSKTEVRAILAGADRLAEHRRKDVAKAWRRYRALIYAAVFTGCRSSELRGLPWREVDLSAATIRIVQRADDDGEIGNPKSAAGWRTIPIPDVLVQILRAWRRSCPAGDLDLVFPTGTGEPESRSNITSRCWYRLQRFIGLVDPIPDDPEAPAKPRYALHELRHVRASLEIESGADPLQIKKLMGHSTIKVTMDNYGHLFPEGDQARAARVAAIAEDLVG